MSEERRTFTLCPQHMELVKLYHLVEHCCGKVPASPMSDEQVVDAMLDVQRIIDHALDSALDIKGPEGVHIHEVVDKIIIDYKNELAWQEFHNSEEWYKQLEWCGEGPEPVFEYPYSCEQ
jgi:hypothetical protein